MTGRTLWHHPNLDQYVKGEYASERLEPCGSIRGDANVVSSRLADSDLHSPVLDIDFPARLVPSTSEGHFHLYLDGLRLEWPKYERLLTALADAGVIEQGYCDAAIRRKMTLVRLSHVRKESA